MQDQGPSISPEVVTSAVWDAISEIPGVGDLYRSSLQSLGERVHLERHGPVRLTSDEAGPLLEIHLVVKGGSDIRALSDAVAAAGAACLTHTTGTPVTHVEVYVDDVAVLDE